MLLCFQGLEPDLRYRAFDPCRDTPKTKQELAASPKGYLLFVGNRLILSYDEDDDGGFLFVQPQDSFNI